MAMQFDTRAYGALSITGAKIANETIDNGKIATNAAIALSKLGTTTASRALQTGAGGAIEVSAVTTTELGYLTGVTSNIQSQLNAINSGYARRKKVINIVDNTQAPPTEVSGDRYILDNTGASHADWDGAAGNSIVEFNGTSWVATTPTEGWVVYNDADNKDYLFVDDGTPVWQARATQSTNLTDGKIWIGDATNSATERTISGDITISNAGVAAIASGVIVNADVSASAGIVESKLSLDYSTSSLNTTLSGHISNTSNPHSVTKSQILTGNLIVNADIDAGAAIVDTKLATISTANKVSGSAVQLNAAGGLENSTGLQINVDASNGTTKINGANELEGLKAKLETKTLIAGDITAQYIDLAKLIHPESLQLIVIGLPNPRQGTDFTLSTEGGVTRVTFAGDLATAGACALIAGDILQMQYLYLN
jgi:hypothetical protein